MKKATTLLVVVLLTILTGCSNVNSPGALTVTPTMTEPRPHATVSASPEATSSPSLLASPEPTLNDNDKEADIKLLLKTNNGCDLPCWWGFELDRTTWGSVEQMLSQLNEKFSELEADRISVTYGSGGLLDLESTQTHGEVTFYVEREVLKSIIISVDGSWDPPAFQKTWDYYSPDKIFLKYGKPSQIKLDVSTYGDTNTAGYAYWLYYEHLGFLIIYNGSTPKEEILHICPNFNDDQNLSFMRIFLNSLNDNLDLEEVVGYETMQLMRPRLKNFEEAVGKSVDTYYSEFLADHQNICFDTPKKLWRTT